MQAISVIYGKFCANAMNTKLLRYKCISNRITYLKNLLCKT